MRSAQPLEFISDGLNALSVLFLLMGLKQSIHVTRAGGGAVPKGVSPQALWFALAAKLCQHGQFVSGASAVAAWRSLSAAYADSANAEFLSDAAGGANLFLSVFVIDGSVYRVTTRMFAIVSALFLLAALPLAGLNPLSCCHRRAPSPAAPSSTAAAAAAAASSTDKKKRRQQQRSAPASSAPPGGETFPLAAVVLIVAIAGCCAIASTGGSLAGKRALLRMSGAFAKFSGTLLELASVQMSAAAWARQGSGFCVSHSLLFRALATIAVLCNAQATGTLLTPAATGMGVIEPLRSASLLAAVQRGCLVCAVLLYSPFLYCYTRFQWKPIALFFAMGAATYAWLPAFGFETDALDSNLNWLWRTAVEGTGKVTGNPPYWCAYIAMFQVLAMTWCVAFAGRSGLCIVIVVAAIASRVLQPHM